MKLAKIDRYAALFVAALGIALISLYSNIAKADTQGFQLTWTQRDIYTNGNHLDLVASHFVLDVIYNGKTTSIAIPGDGTLTTYTLPIAAISPVCSADPQSATATMRIVDSAGQASKPSNTVTLSDIIITCSAPSPTGTPDAPSGLSSQTIN